MTSKEALEKLRLLAVDSESDLSNSWIAKEYADIIEKDLKFLEFLKEQFNFKFHNEKLKFISIVGKKDYDECGGIDLIAYSDLMQNDEEMAFLKEYLKEKDNGK